MTETSTLKDKIQKCLALSKDAGATEAERNAAVTKAMALCTKYNLCLDEILKASDDELSKLVKRSPEPRPAHAWLKQLVGPIARVNMCKHVLECAQNGKWQPDFLGEEHNVQFCIWLYYYLFDSITREARFAARGISGKKAAFIRSFENGASKRIAERLGDIKENIKSGIHVEIESGEKTNLPALADMYEMKMEAAEEFKQTQYNNLQTMRVRTKSSSNSGYNQGRAFGDRVQLNRPVNGSSTKQIKR